MSACLLERVHGVFGSTRRNGEMQRTEASGSAILVRYAKCDQFRPAYVLTAYIQCLHPHQMSYQITTDTVSEQLVIYVATQDVRS